MGQPDYRPIKKSLRVGFYYGNGMGGVRTTCFAENLFFHPLKKVIQPMTELKIISYEQFLEVWQPAQLTFITIFLFKIKKNAPAQYLEVSHETKLLVLSKIPTFFSKTDYQIMQHENDYRLVWRNRTILKVRLMPFTKMEEIAKIHIWLYPEYPLKSFN
jgi:hypothetical protein